MHQNAQKNDNKNAHKNQRFFESVAELFAQPNNRDLQGEYVPFLLSKDIQVQEADLIVYNSTLARATPALFLIDVSCQTAAICMSYQVLFDNH